jgi:hypothetical protein
MRRLLSKIEWLLVDEPEGRDLFLAALFFSSCPASPWRYPCWASTRGQKAYPVTWFPWLWWRQRSLRGRSSTLC